MSDPVEDLKTEMAYAVSRKKAEELSDVIAELLVNLGDHYSAGEIVLGMAMTLGRVGAATLPTNHTEPEWEARISRVFSMVYATYREKERG